MNILYRGKSYPRLFESSLSRQVVLVKDFSVFIFDTDRANVLLVFDVVRRVPFRT